MQFPIGKIRVPKQIHHEMYSYEYVDVDIYESTGGYYYYNPATFQIVHITSYEPSIKWIRKNGILISN